VHDDPLAVHDGRVGVAPGDRSPGPGRVGQLVDLHPDVQGLRGGRHVARDRVRSAPDDRDIERGRPVEQRRDHDDADQQDERDRGRDLEPAIARALDELATRDDRPQALPTAHRAT
jgi:hypothetical protein